MIELGIEGALPWTTLEMRPIEGVSFVVRDKDKMLAEVRKHLRLNIKPHESRVKVPKLLDNFTHTRRDQRQTTLRFLTSGRNVKKLDEKETVIDNPFTDLCSESEAILVSRFNVRKPKVENDAETKKLNSCVVNPILERLQVPEEPPPCNLVEEDPLYFESVKGRLLRERFSKLDFSKTHKAIFFKHLFASRCLDDVLVRKEHLQLDIFKLEKLDKELDETKKLLEAFISYINSASVVFVEEQIKLEGKWSDLRGRLARRKSHFMSVKYSLYKKDVELATALNCRDLLNRLSPPTFQREYISGSMRYRKIIDKIIYSVSYHYQSYCCDNPESETDHFLDEAIQMFLNQVNTIGPPRIYFKYTWQIDLFLRKMELACSDMVQCLESISKFNREIDEAGRNIRENHSRVVNAIEGEILREESKFIGESKRAAELERLANTDGIAKIEEYSCRDAILETAALVEYLYNEMFKPSRTVFTIVEMMRHIERELVTVENNLRNLDPKQLALFEKKVVARLNRKKKVTDFASRQFREAKTRIAKVMDVLEKPQINFGNRKLMKKSRLTRKIRRKSTKVGTKKFQHLQLDEICSRSDVEQKIKTLIRAQSDTKHLQRTVRQQILQQATNYEESHEEAQSRSSRSQSITISEPEYTEIEYDPSFELFDFGYDSEEELIRQNLAKRKGSTKVPSGTVLYDLAKIDDRFLVEKEGDICLTPKDRRHKHRPSRKPKTNPLNWR